MWFEQWRKKWKLFQYAHFSWKMGEESWKFCLNLCPHKWLNPTRNRVSSFIHKGCLYLNILFWFNLLNLSFCFSKAITNSKFQILLLRLFQSITVDKKRASNVFMFRAMVVIMVFVKTTFERLLSSHSKTFLVYFFPLAVYDYITECKAARWLISSKLCHTF